MRSFKLLAWQISLLVHGLWCPSQSFTIPLSTVDRGVRPSRWSKSSFDSLSALSAHNHHQDGSIRLEDILKENGYDSRLVRIRSPDLPLVAEIYEHGGSKLVLLESLCPSESDSAEPKAEIRYLGPANITKNVSFGDLTTIWTDGDGGVQDLEGLVLDKVQEQLDKLSLPFVERLLNRIYMSRVGTSRSSAKGIQKKQVGQLAQRYFPDEQQPLVENVMRQVIKAGVGFSRLISSDTVQSFLYKKGPRLSPSFRRAIATAVISRDVRLGGRFKRFPCMIVDSRVLADRTVSQLTIVNGGWLITDQSVRAGAEARHFVERFQEEAKNATTTVADERIIRRLECLALGELFTSDEELRVDVKETLKGMDLPVTKKGATEALVRIGRWSGKEDVSKLEPWSTEILQAASWFAHWKANQTKKGAISEGRVDLTMFPSVCIDHQRTSFRDDAIGIRPRSATGRAVDHEASQWELLVHVVDVSDILLEEVDTHEDLLCLKRAAQSRGSSRYDLPQPLHLLPPKVLGALSLSADKDSNCCVTVWVYIDERDGRLIDAGLERSVVYRPHQLSFSEATALMNKPATTNSHKIRALLLVVERNLMLWRQRHFQENASAKKRETRLAERERLSMGVASDESEAIGDGDAFQRTRSHRLVDTALDLYGFTLHDLLKRRNAPVPMAMGAEISRGGRVATAPLRRYVDGEAQRQALATLCNVGRPLTLEECRLAGKLANDARNAISYVRASRSR